MSHRVNSAQPVRPRVEAPVTEGLGPTYSPSPPIVNSNGQRNSPQIPIFPQPARVDIYEFGDSIKLWVDMPGVKGE